MRNNLIRGPGAVLATTLLLAVVPTTRAAPGVDQGRPLFSLDGHSLDVSTVAFSPDGKRIVASGTTRICVCVPLMAGSAVSLTVSDCAPTVPKPT